MILLEYLLVLTGVICCTATPASDPDSCRPPPRYNDKELQGEWNEELYKPGTRATYLCRPGFVRIGSFQSVCSEGTWLEKFTGQCKKKSCGHPGDIDFGSFELKKGDAFVFGAIVEYTCNDGYEMISRYRTRECTATGWTNDRPECQVRYCPLIQVNSNVKIVNPANEEEYSVGQVIKFECKNVNQKLNGVSEIFCTSEGEWNAPTPTCDDISCSPPNIEKGKVSNLKERYQDKDTTEYSCDSGYKPSTLTLLTCTKRGWSPMPVCEEIVCYPETVKDGKVQFNKGTYKDGETVQLICNEGYQIEHKPEEPRICTSYGWSPPLKCISKKCDEPVVLNGRIQTYYYRVYYLYLTCDSGFLTARRTQNDYIYCKKNGLEPQPKCFRQCYTPHPSSINAHITYRPDHVYIEGDKVHIQCYRDHTTLDGSKSGWITCLPDGKFAGEKCHKTCPLPKLVNGKYNTNKNVFEVGAHVIYECNEGYMSSNKRFEGTSLCGSNGWQPKPECKEIECTVKTRQGEQRYKSGEVIRFKCREDYNLVGSNSSQCFYYGWGPAIPICIGPDQEKDLAQVDIITKLRESNCPPASEPPNAQVINPNAEDEIEIACNPGYLLIGSAKMLCRDGKWQSPPQCIEKIRCSRPPTINNGKISETSEVQYYSGSTVTYICSEGFHISGSAENKCMDGKWLQSPTCVENSCGNPPEIENGHPQDGKGEYKHGETTNYQCSVNYKLSESEAAICSRGKWERIPKCTYSSCGSPPKITNGGVKGRTKSIYLTGEKVTYECVQGFTMGKNANDITCEESVWTDPPQCKRIGQTCGPPPVVQFGLITEMKKLSYPSGSSVTYKCVSYHKLEGKEIITCRDGEWEKEPVCRVPCTTKEADMEKNNIRFKWIEEKKLYSEHFSNISFACLSGYQISDEKLLRIQCLDGVLKFPKCIREGSCVLQQTEMSRNNIRYNKGTEIAPGQTIEFECEEGMVPENVLTGRCLNKIMEYPKCSDGRPCLPPQISNALVSSEIKEVYESGSSVTIKCEDTFVLNGLNGLVTVNCENGEWKELPQCFKPCKINATLLDTKHIEIVSPENLPEILKHSTDVTVKCKANFKQQGSSLFASCFDGIMKYPRCFPGGTCRILQQDLDDNFLELDEVHENEVFYGEGETVNFKCKAGYRNRSGLTATCAKQKNTTEYKLQYPACTRESSV